MNRVEEWVLENKDKIEKGVEIMGQGCEVLAATVGQFHPILEAVFLASAELLGNPEGKEAKFLAEQFEKINQKLEGIRDEMDQIALELQRTSMNKQNFDYEAKIISQYEKFQDFVNAKPKFKEKKKDKFITQYENTGRDLNIDSLYNAVTGENISGDAILDTVVTTEQRSRKPVEEFCARLKKIFVMGIIAVMGHTALKEGSGRRGHSEEMAGSHGRSRDTHESGGGWLHWEFPSAGQGGCGASNSGGSSQRWPRVHWISTGYTCEEILLVSWSVRVFNHSGIFFWNWLAGKKYHGSGGGGGFFDLLTENNIRIVVSFQFRPETD